MSKLTHLPAWQALTGHRDIFRTLTMREMFRQDEARFEKCSIQHDGLLLDYSKHLINDETLQHLLALADQTQLKSWIERLFTGEKINTSEQRAVLHTALRAAPDAVIRVDGHNVVPDVQQVLQHMRRFSESVRLGKFRGYTGKPLRHIVNIGVGGSALGPLLACEALRPYAHPEMQAHFISNIDAADIVEHLRLLDPETTLFIVSSKTFTTQETIANALTARDWLVQQLGTEAAVAHHFVAVSTHKEATLKFGIAPDNVFEFWDWVGGRYSLWSAIGLPLALYVGMDHFEAMLQGARVMDTHFHDAPAKSNMPIIMGLLGVWYTSFFEAGSHAVLPYDQSLHRLPAYLQQLEMESNGKSVDRDGNTVDYLTQAVVWGEAGTNGQHSFYQLFHQGTRLVPTDFLAPIHSQNPIGEHHAMLIANCFAQTEALMLGKTVEEARAELQALGLEEAALEKLLPYKVFAGNRPSTTLLYDRLDPKTLGMLLALYEHKTFVQSVIWNVNAFDQWGVEYGKQLANKLLPELQGKAPISEHDGSTTGLIRHFLSRQSK